MLRMGLRGLGAPAARIDGLTGAPFIAAKSALLRGV
jgi:hypothetical protein